jgi:ribosomal protein S15P/S13E
LLRFLARDQSKFDLVIAALDLNAATDVRDVLKNPPEEDKYAAIKKALIDRLAVSEASRIQQILSKEQMGDRTPSQHLRHLQAQAGGNFSATVLTSIWMDALPSDVKLIIAGDAELPLDKLAAMADRIMDVAGPKRRAGTGSPAGGLGSATDRQLAALTKQISALTAHLTGQSSSDKAGPAVAKPNARPKRARSPATPRKRSFDAANSGTCWYHWRFKDEATKCTPPCSWTKDSGNGSNQS